MVMISISTDSLSRYIKGGSWDGEDGDLEGGGAWYDKQGGKDGYDYDGDGYDDDGDGYDGDDINQGNDYTGPDDDDGGWGGDEDDVVEDDEQQGDDCLAMECLLSWSPPTSNPPIWNLQTSLCCTCFDQQPRYVKFHYMFFFKLWFCCVTMHHSSLQPLFQFSLIINATQGNAHNK